jgi:site-specific recombinase XerD
VFVNLWAEPLGAPMRYGRVADLFRSLSRRAGLARAVTPHMLRHAAGSALTAAGGLDVAQAILGHASITSTQIYVHASTERQRDAVERLAQAQARSRHAGATR